MCVLTFVPSNEFGYILTNNRDENIGRPRAISPKKYKLASNTVYFPKDAKAGGTWIANNQNYSLCLLNGAHEKHVPKASYAKSRGFVILEFFDNPNLNYFNKSNFLGIENFTLIVIVNFEKKILQIVWDGAALEVTNLEWNQPQIWSSSTLYNNEIRTKRKALFSAFLEKNSQPNYNEMIDFHRFADVGDKENNLIMERADGTITQSITQIHNTENGIRFSYFDLLAEQQKSLIII
jgi:hypothetical protein